MKNKFLIILGTALLTTNIFIFAGKRRTNASTKSPSLINSLSIKSILNIK